MVPGDPQQRSARLREVMEILRGEAPAEDRDLVLSFAPLVFEDMPPSVALELPPSAVATRLLSHFRFVAREMPPSHQLYRGLPGIHVAVWNPGDERARSIGGGSGLPLDTTIVQTHTPDRPFIFDSLKNYFQKSGVRVYSAIHPMFTVRRQWERIVSFGKIQEEGSRESYTFFQLEPLESRDRRRRMEHEVFSLLKAVFLAVDDFTEMQRSCRDLVSRLRSPRGDEGQLASARAFVEWLFDDNYIFMGTVSYRVGRDGRFKRMDETANGAFADPTLLPIVFPGVAEHIETHLRPRADDDRIVDLDFSTGAGAIYHLDPIEDLALREWDEEGRLKSLTFLLGRFARSAFAQRADRVPVLRDKQ
ncbi:MAG: NAD-glutamate dehydrogenase, partial [Acidobacteria bacterium]|nr:NAD-glutamate dehydrogenase [Acidobacteriota bacterium]